MHFKANWRHDRPKDLHRGGEWKIVVVLLLYHCNYRYPLTSVTKWNPRSLRRRQPNRKRARRHFLRSLSSRRLYALCRFWEWKWRGLGCNCRRRCPCLLAKDGCGSRHVLQGGKKETMESSRSMGVGFKGRSWRRRVGVSRVERPRSRKKEELGEEGHWVGGGRIIYRMWRKD